MTVIKSISAKGFKSFAKRTELLFGDNFNIIIGPNGSGKSNLCDMLCFVLGKSSAKSLRAEKSANLIYNGGKSKQPAKEAEASIVFDNSKKHFPIESREVEISRMIRQNGNSTYRINGEIVTRQQVLDLLNKARVDPDGHNIILQGDIIKFTELKPEERREIIEEVSGISVYEEKKQKAIRELEKVEGRLNEANIILTEREAYLRELKKDRDQALRYKELEGNIKSNKATYVSINIKQLETKKEDIENEINKNEKEIAKINEKINEIKKEIEERNSKINEINKTIEESSEVKQKELHQSIENLKTELIKLRMRKETCENEVKRIEERKGQLGKNLIELDKKVDDLWREKEDKSKKKEELIKKENEINRKLEKFKKEYGIKDDILDIEKQISGLEDEINKIRDEKQELLREKDSLIFQLKNTEENLSSNKVDQVEDVRKEFKKVTVELSKSLNENSVIAAQLGRNRESLVKKNEELESLRIKQFGIKEFMSADIAIKKILEMNDKKVYGLVTELGKVSSKYSLALEVAAGARINSLVVEDDVIAAKYIKYLKDNKLGVVTFLPLDKVKARDDTSIKQFLNFSGVKGLAVDLISYDSKFKNVFSYAFGNTIVVDDINVARKIGIGRVRMVTLEGDLMEVSGAMIGGYRKRKGIGFKEREIVEGIDSISKDVENLVKMVELLEKKKNGSDELVYSLKNKKAELEGELIKYEKSFGSLDFDKLKDNKKELNEKLKVLDKGIKDLDSDFDVKNKEIIKLKEDRKGKSLMGSKFGNELEEFQNELRNNRELIGNLDSDIKNLNININDVLVKEKDKIKKILEDSDKEKNSFIKESSTLDKEVKNKEGNLVKQEGIEKKFYSEFKALFAKRNTINDEMQKKENIIAREQDRIKEVQNKVNKYSIDKAKIIGELEGLNKEFEPYKEEKLRRGISLEELKQEIKKFENLLSNFGNVNLRALEVYEKVNEEYNGLIEKIKKLKKEKEDVLNMMHEIDMKKKDLFMKTYNVIEDNFKKIFASLSDKGEAHLELEDKELVFNGGLNIKVKLTGNKFLDIRSLSGGEKTLTALAFIFAIQELQPAPFYFLDEVDAALDKRNSELLSKLIAKYAKNSQYIVISHNDAVITEADNVYGVSMQNGESKVVSLKI